MKGHTAVLDVLNAVLTGELTAINQYFIHAKMCRNWGYSRLAAKIHAESIDEMKHADSLIERILFLEGVPNLQRLNKVNVGETVPEQFRLDLALELDALTLLRTGMKTAHDLGDFGSEAILRSILVAEEEHTDWLETQLGLIAQLGEANYLAQQLKD